MFLPQLVEQLNTDAPRSSPKATYQIEVQIIPR